MYIVHDVQADNVAARLVGGKSHRCRKTHIGPYILPKQDSKPDQLADDWTPRLRKISAQQPQCKNLGCTVSIFCVHVHVLLQALELKFYVQ